MYTVGNVDGGGSIEFGVCAVDPLNPSANGASCSYSPAIASATGDAGVLTLSAPHSSSVVVSWAIDGGFYAPVWLSVQSIGSPVGGGSGGGGGGAQDAGVYILGRSPVDTSIKDAGTTCTTLVGTSSTAICGTLGWQKSVIQNQGPNTIWIGGQANISTPDGIDAGCVPGQAVVSGQSYEWDGNVQVYGVADVAQVSLDAGTVTNGIR